MPPNVPAITLPSGGAYGYAATTDPQQDSSTHTLIGAGGGGANANDAYIVQALGTPNNNPNDIAVATVIGIGLLAARPLTATEGYLWYSTDIFRQDRWTSGAWQSEAMGTPSPLTTKGDIWGFTTVNARVPVGADGRILEADSAQAIGVGYSTRTFDFNSQNATAMQSLSMTGGTATTTPINIGHSQLAANIGTYRAISMTPMTQLLANANASATGVYAQPTIHVQASISGGNGIQGLRFAPTVIEDGAGGYTLNHLDMVYAQLAGGTTNITEGNFFKGVIVSLTNYTNLYGFHLDGGNQGMLTGALIGLKIHNLGASTSWGFQIDGTQPSYHQGPLTIGAAATPIASAVLDLSQTTTGALVVPKMTNAQMNALTAADGMIVYTTDAPIGFKHRASGAWTAF